ncbi:hypothetical protein COF64_07890 [Bacillus sp. AFS043905]|nr:hypothetical protein COF64_07890 [Bacillus sp. AFS043905]
MWCLTHISLRSPIFLKAEPVLFHKKKAATATSLFKARPISSVIFNKTSFLRKLEQIVKLLQTNGVAKRAEEIA